MLLVSLLALVIIFAVIFASHVLINESEYVTFFWYFVAGILFFFSLVGDVKYFNTFLTFSIVIGLSMFSISHKP